MKKRLISSELISLEDSSRYQYGLQQGLFMLLLSNKKYTGYWLGIFEKTVSFCDMQFRNNGEQEQVLLKGLMNPSFFRLIERSERLKIVA